MENKTINAVTNAGAANALLEKALADAEPAKEVAKITPPSDTLVNLPGGLILFTGEIVKTAEIRELTGRDEEALAKVTGFGRIFNTILSRAVVSVGLEKADDRILDQLLASDRDELLLGIAKATFGNTASLAGWCVECNEYKEVEIDIDTDIKRKTLQDPIYDRTFKVKGKKNEYTVTLPTGVTQRQLAANDDKNMAELSTLLLEQTVLEIDGTPLVSKIQVQNLPLLDRRKISQEIASRNCGPQFDDITLPCGECDGEVVVPISLGALFRF